MLLTIILTGINGLFAVIGIWSASRSSSNAYLAQNATDRAEMHAGHAVGAGKAISEALVGLRRGA